MKYSDALRRAFSSLKSGALWGFAASALAAMFGVFVVLAGGAYLLVGRTGLERSIRAFGGGSPSASDLTAVLALTGAAVLALLLTVPLGLISHGGLVHLSDEVLAGRPARVGGGWGFGIKRIGRTFAIDFVVGLVVFGGILVAMVPMVAAIAGLVAADKGNPAAAILGVCGGYLVFFLLVLALSLFASGYESLALRYGLIGGRTSGDALSSGWKAFRARWKNVLVFALIVTGLQYAYGMVTALIILPLEFLLMPGLLSPGGAGQDPSALTSQMIRYYAIIYPVIFLLQLPWTILLASLWTAFFRQLTGLDVPPQPRVQYQPAPVPAPPVGSPYEPPLPPEPPVGYAPGEPPRGIEQPPAEKDV